MVVIHVARDFAETPGGRWIQDGDFSGEEFREKFLEPLFENATDESKVRIILDGVEGYAVSFLEEVFGGLARKHGKARCLRRLEFESVEDPLLPEQITRYIGDCHPKP